MPEPEAPAAAAFDEARSRFVSGLASLEAGRLEDAEQHFAASLALLPGRVSTLVNLAATRLRLGRPRDALAAADEVLATEPDNPEAWYHRGTALGQLQRHDDALASYRRLLALAPDLAPAWSDCGTLLREMNRPDEAADAFRQAIAHGADPALNGYYLAAVSTTRPAPATAPRAYVESLFDTYADGFEQHLLESLHYRAHTVLTQQLQRLAPGRRFACALDLGCGTGLCGPLVKPMADRLVGVDLSGRMLEQARALGVYDTLVHGDLLDHLRTGHETHELVLAADVFIYVGDLAPVLEALHPRMADGALLCFSAEPTEREDQDLTLGPSLRYAHSERYLRSVAAQHGFTVADVLRQPIRVEQGRSIDGLFVCLARGPQAP